MGSVTVLRLPSGERLDVFELTLRLYDGLPACPHRFMGLVVDAIDQLHDTHGIELVARTNHTLTLKRHDDKATTQWTLCGINDREMSFERLLWLERLAQYIFVVDPAVHGPRLGKDEYARWQDGGDAKTMDIVQPQATATWFGPWFHDFLDCYARVYGPISFYWLLPMLYVMRANELHWPRAAAVQFVKENIYLRS